ncbi:MAG: hypothetical protein SOX75_01700 [Candidatus Limivicinus sp.]|nr:hypothetical protein [Candidatus Limivicinus sp.]
MKKVTKFLSILLLVAMCMSLFGGSAYAVELEGGNTSSSAPTVVNDGVQLNGDDTYLDGGSSGSTDLEISEEPTIGPILKAPVKPPVISGGEAEINGTQYETLEKALAAAKSGDTIKFVKNITSNSPLTISTAVTIDLNDFTWNVNGGLTVNAAVTVTDKGSAKNGQLYMNSVVNVNSTLTFKNIDLYADKGFSVSAYGKVEMKDVHSKGDYNFFKDMNASQILIYSGTFVFNPAGFIVPGTIIDDKNGNGAFIVKIDDASKYEASIDGKFYETLQAAFDAAYNGATVYVIQQTGDNELSDAAINGSKNIILNLNNEEITAGNITVNTGSTLTIMNGWIDQSIENHGTLTVSGNAKVATLRVKGGAAYINGKVDTLNTDDGSTYMSDSNASIGKINVYSKPNLYISGGTVGNISENTTGAPKLVTGGTWKDGNVSGYVADGYEAVQERVGEWIVKAKGAAPVVPTPTPGIPTTPPSPTGAPVSATITLDNGTRAYQYNQLGNNNPALRFTANPAGNVTYVTAYTASGAQTLIEGTHYSYNRQNGQILLYSTYVESIKAQTVTLYFYFSGETNPASATVYVVPYYSLNTSSYTRSSGSAVYFTLSTGSAYGYRYGTSADFYKATALPAGSYSETQSGSYTTLRFTNSFLDSLANGSYYFFYVLDNNNTRVCMNSGSSALRISGSGSPVVPPTIDDYMVDYISGIDSWYSGDEKLGFRIQPGIASKGGIAVDGYKVPGEDYVDRGTGLIYLGINYLNDLATGWHTLTVYYDEMFQNPNRSIQFYVGPSLKAVDTDKHVINSSKDLKFVCSDTIDPKNVRVGSGNGWLEEGNQFTISGNGRYITLKAKFLNARTAGETYTLNVKTTSGEWTSCNFRILTTAQAASSPRTGDNSNIGLWLVFMAVSGGAVAVALPKLKKGKD